MISCQCTSTYIDLEGGFWGLIDESGNKYLPVNMVNQIKTEGASHTVTLRPLDVMGIEMWGAPVEIVSFRTS